MREFIRVLVPQIGALALTVLAGGLLTAVLVRVSPGFGVDERDLDPRLTEASRQANRAQRGVDDSIVGFYAARLNRTILHGDLGFSASLNRPIAELLRERLPVTAQIMGIGLVGGWSLAFAMAMPAVLSRSRVFRGLAGSLQQILMCLPAAALAVIVFDFGGPTRALVALAICPRVFEYLRNLLAEAYSHPHILTARAKGLGSMRIWARHVMPSVAPQLLALAGVSVSISFGAAIPIEALCDLPGIGQLAWKAAIARDLPLLLTITFLVVIGTQICNSISDWTRLGGKQA